MYIYIYMYVCMYARGGAPRHYKGSSGSSGTVRHSAIITFEYICRHVKTYQNMVSQTCSRCQCRYTCLFLNTVPHSHSAGRSAFGRRWTFPALAHVGGSSDLSTSTMPSWLRRVCERIFEVPTGNRFHLGPRGRDSKSLKAHQIDTMGCAQSFQLSVTYPGQIGLQNACNILYFTYFNWFFKANKPMGYINIHISWYDMYITYLMWYTYIIYIYIIKYNI